MAVVVAVTVLIAGTLVLLALHEADAETDYNRRS